MGDEKEEQDCRVPDEPLSRLGRLYQTRRSLYFGGVWSRVNSCSRCCRISTEQALKKFMKLHGTFGNTAESRSNWDWASYLQEKNRRPCIFTCLDVRRILTHFSSSLHEDLAKVGHGVAGHVWCRCTYRCWCQVLMILTRDFSGFPQNRRLKNS